MSKALTRKKRRPSAADKRTRESIVADVGLRMKRLRTVAGLTLEQLAEHSGVSRAMLSKVERGEKSPTLAIVVGIAQGLDISLTTLLGAEPDPADVAIIRVARRQSFKDPETGFERHLLSPSHVDNGVELVLHRIPPGKSSGILPRYSVPTEKYLVLHEGELTVFLGETPHRLKAGDSMFFEVKAPYRFVNEGRKGCAYYMAIVRKR